MYGLALGRAGAEQPNSIQNAALGILRRYGTDAHVYLPGSTVTTYGPELVTNGDFSNGTTGWSGIKFATVSNPAGQLVVTQGGDVNGGASSQITLVIGSTYRLSFSLNANAGAADLFAFVSSNSTGTIDRSLTFDCANTAGPYTVTFKAITTSSYIVISAGGGGFDAGESFAIDNISIREVITTSSVTAGLPTNNYTLSDGSTGYSAVDGTAGLVLDAAGSVGAELVTNGDFSDGATGWTASPGTQISALAGAAWRIASVDGSGVSVAQTTLIPTVGKTYKVSVEITATTGSGILIDLGGATSPSLNTVGVKEFFLTCTSTVALVVKRGGVCDTTFDNISVREVTGTHVTQATTANKPALRRGLYNLLTYSQDFTQAVWAVQATCTKGASGLFNLPAVNDAFLQTHTATYGAGTALTAAYELSGSGTVTVEIYRNDAGTPEGYQQSITLNTTPTIFVAPFTFTASHTSYRARVIRLAGDTATAVTISKAGLFQGTLTAAQILAEGGIPTTTSAAASNPSAGRYWWDFPTAGKGLVLGSPVAQMADDSWCVVCVSAVSSGSDKYIANLGCGAANQLISSVCIKSAGFAQAAWVDDGAAHTRTVVDAVNHHGIPTVVTAVKRGGVGYLRVNGVQIGSIDLTVMGATTVTAGMIGGYIPSNTALQYVGAMGAPQMGKGTISDADLLTIERQCAANFPTGPVF